MMRTGFSALDNLTGGLAERQGYLVYGNAQEAKSALALAFLASGVANGESVALVTERSFDAIQEEARGYGFDLSEGLKSGKFQFFEYPEGVASSTMQLMDDARIIEEFQTLTGQHEIRRLVFDPVTPLLNAQHPAASAKRFHAIISAFSRMGATALYLVHSAGSGDNVPSVREMAHGVMRVDSGGMGSGRIVFERWPGASSAESLDFGIVAGIGLVSLSRLPSGTAAVSQDPTGAGLQFSAFQIPATRASAVGTLAPPRFTPSLPAPATTTAVETVLAETVEDEKPRILLVHPDSAQRSLLNSLLSGDYRVSEAHSVATGMAMLSSEAPDLLIFSHELSGACGGAVAFKLRQSGYNMPIIVVGSRVRRISDKGKFLQAGVDVFLDLPLEIQLLSRHVDNLLRRVGRLKVALGPDGEPPQLGRRANVTCTMDLDYFCERVAEEYARPELVSAAPMFTLRMPGMKSMVEELSSTVLLTARATDVIYVGNRGVSVLLVESTSADVFMARLRASWASETPPLFEVPRISSHGSVLDQLRQFVHDSTGHSFPQPAGNRLNGRSYEAVVTGHRLENPE
jgi:KaiC/GvpD/RAD55 family RecA-like ATPase/CheY-like chemotaxis protein